MGRWLSAFIGAVVTFIIGWFPFIGPIAGGTVAGFLRGSDTKESGISGTLAGMLAALPITLLVVLFVGLGAVVMIAEGDAAAGIGGILFYLIVILFSLAYFVGMTAIGGVIGAAITNRQAP